MSQVPVVLVKANGASVDYTPSSAVTAGDVIIINGKLYVAKLDIAAGRLGSLCPLTETPVYRWPKDSGTCNDRDDLYWHAAGNPVGGTAGTGAVNTTSNGGTYIGKAQGAALTGDTTVLVENFAGTTVSTTYTNVLSNVIADPGSGAAIPVTAGGSVPLTLAGVAETNTLADPTFAGQLMLINVSVFTASATRIITAASTFDGSHTTITLNSLNDWAYLVATKVGAAYKWQLIAQSGCVLS